MKTTEEISAVQILDVSREGSVRAPESDRPIIAAGGQEGSIGAPGHAPDLLRVPLEGLQAAAVGHRPDPRGLVVRRGGQPAGVGSEGDAADAVRVTLEDRAGTLRWPRPRSALCCRLIPRPGGDGLPAERRRQASESRSVCPLSTRSIRPVTVEMR